MAPVARAVGGAAGALTLIAVGGSALGGHLVSYLVVAVALLSVAVLVSRSRRRTGARGADLEHATSPSSQGAGARVPAAPDLGASTATNEPRRVYFDSDLPPSYFEGDSERAREVAAGPHRKSLVITAADIEGRIKNEYPELYADACELAKTVEPPPPESLRATDDPDVYSIRVGQALRVVR